MLKNKLLLLIPALLCALHGRAQFAPQATMPGSDAIPAGSSLFTAWASHCEVQRGYMDIADPTLGMVNAGLPEHATGSPDGSIVSLGDSGIAVLTFPVYITNGPGADFAVFENGFPNPGNPAEAFLELAFVEVSSDGEHFFRFPAQSLTQADSQISSIAGQDYMDAALLNNLAGKYIAGYGVPFDLQELDGTTGLDINRITHVRIVDVIGTIGVHGTNDVNGHRINDPYPTAFPAGGFDLDAVGVIHGSPLSVEEARLAQVRIFPNPANDFITILLPRQQVFQLTIRNAAGQTVCQQPISGAGKVAVSQLPAGVYFVQLQNETQSCVTRFIRP